MVWGIGLYFGAHIMKKNVAVLRITDKNFTCCMFPLSGKRKYLEEIKKECKKKFLKNKLGYLL